MSLSINNAITYIKIPYASDTVQARDWYDTFSQSLYLSPLIGLHFWRHVLINLTSTTSLKKMFFSLYVYEGSSQSSEESVVFVAVFEREPDFLGNVVWDRDTPVKCPNKTSCANLCVCVSVCFLAMLQAHWRISSHQDIPTGPGLGRVPGLSPACVLAEIITHTWSAAWSWSWSSSPFTLNFPALKLRLCSGLKPSLLHLCDQLNQKKRKKKSSKNIPPTKP